MVQGVTAGFTTTLEIHGVGYRAALRGSDLALALGYSDPVKIAARKGIEFEVPVPTCVIIKGNSKQQVGEIAAIISKQRPPEPYKGNFFFNDTATTEIYTLSLHDALPI